MKKNIEILINNKTIEVHFNNELKNHKIILKFEILNSYQLICMNYEIINKSNIELSSTDIRNINIHTLIKRSIKAIESYKNIDPKDFKLKTNGLYDDNFPYKKFVKEIKNRTIKDRKILLSLYTPTYIKKNQETMVTTLLKDYLYY
ncbi:MAG: hypothetical protein Ct9H90mP3_2470 [Flammeovirgaceae bacterium]|nr:MAG: hypothetical protein Ct9H90mP3_2470 [Flammeovirgaceae bacterium]